MQSIINETKKKMEETISVLGERFATVRAGRANPAMLDNITVEYYGANTPLNQVANISVPEARQLFIKPYDKGILKDIETALIAANLGITPVNNGEFVILTMPELTEESRRTYVRQVKQMAEEGKISLRTAREDARNTVRSAELSEDEEERYYKQIQDLINEFNKEIDNITKVKEDELMTI